jgi:hypothetical protein
LKGFFQFGSLVSSNRQTGVAWSPEEARSARPARIVARRHLRFPPDHDAQVVCFTTGRGSVSGCRPVPSIKIAGNTPLFERMREDMDVNAGRVVDGTATVDLRPSAAQRGARGRPG